MDTQYFTSLMYVTPLVGSIITRAGKIDFYYFFRKRKRFYLTLLNKYICLNINDMQIKRHKFVY